MHVWVASAVASVTLCICLFKLAFHDADTNTDTDILVRILADTSASHAISWSYSCRWQAERHADILATILARMSVSVSVSVSVSASWNASFTGLSQTVCICKRKTIWAINTELGTLVFYLPKPRHAYWPMRPKGRRSVCHRVMTSATELQVCMSTWLLRLLIANCDIFTARQLGRGSLHDSRRNTGIWVESEAVACRVSWHVLAWSMKRDYVPRAVTL